MSLHSKVDTEPEGTIANWSDSKYRSEDIEERFSCCRGQVVADVDDEVSDNCNDDDDDDDLD